MLMQIQIFSFGVISSYFTLLSVLLSFTITWLLPGIAITKSHENGKCLLEYLLSGWSAVTETILSFQS